MKTDLLVILILTAIMITSSGLILYINMPYQEPHHLVIYVAGKYWNSTDQGRLDNTNKAIDAGIQILYKCNYAIIPHFGYYIDKRMNQPLKNSDWYVIDNMILLKADGLLKISNSIGADAEEQLAKKLGIKVYYEVNDIPNRCK